MNVKIWMPGENIHWAINFKAKGSSQLRISFFSYGNIMNTVINLTAVYEILLTTPVTNSYNVSITTTQQKYCSVFIKQSQTLMLYSCAYTINVRLLLMLSMMLINKK